MSNEQKRVVDNASERLVYKSFHSFESTDLISDKRSKALGYAERKKLHVPASGLSIYVN